MISNMDLRLLIGMWVANAYFIGTCLSNVGTLYVDTRGKIPKGLVLFILFHPFLLSLYFSIWKNWARAGWRTNRSLFVCLFFLNLFRFTVYASLIKVRRQAWCTMRHHGNQHFTTSIFIQVCYLSVEKIYHKGLSHCHIAAVCVTFGIDP